MKEKQAADSQNYRELSEARAMQAKGYDVNFF